LKRILTLFIVLFILLNINPVYAQGDNSNTSQAKEIITFPDGDLEKMVMIEIDKYKEDIYREDVEKITKLDCSGVEISSLEGIQYLENLVGLDLTKNEVVDISPLKSLTNLHELYLSSNPITDYTPVLLYYDNLEEKDFRLDVDEWEKKTTKDPMKSWTIKFNQSLNSKTINPETIYIKDGNNETVKINIVLSDNRKSIVVKPIKSYEIGETYCLYITTKIKYGSNNKGLKNIVKMLFEIEPENSEIINFEDSNLEESVIDAINKHKGSIYKEDVEKITHLECEDDISSLEGIQNLTNLYSLEINECETRDLSPLESLKKLKALEIDGSDIRDIKSLGILTNLTELGLYKCGIEDISALENLVNLKTLGLDGNEISDMTPLKKFTKLENLYLGRNNIKDISMLGNLTNLKSLYLQNNEIRDISVLKNLTNLEDVVLSNNNIEDISPLSNLKNLYELILRTNKISDISPLKDLAKLEILLLFENPITDYSPVSEYYDKLRKKDFELNKGK